MRRLKPAYYFIFFILVFFISTVSCSKVDPVSTNETETEEHFQLNDWIRQHMDFYYFWNSIVPEVTDGVADPKDFFYGMLAPTDVFSTISDDADAYMNDVVGSSYSAGYSPAFGRFSNSDNVFIIVRFVYPDTPADNAGLKRGDIILKINGQQLSLTNYLELYYAESPTETVTLGVLNNETNSISEGGTLSFKKEQLDLNPVVHSKIFDHEGLKTGYIFYSRFVDGPDNQFVDALNDSLSKLQAEGISDLIIDLRYNPGGTISTAQAFANALAPRSSTVNEEVFVKFQYNEKYEQHIINEEGLDSEKLTIKLSEGPVNLNLDRIYFLTSSSSASASELLINGLAPYQEVIQIGEPTYGKFYGAYVIPNYDFNYAIIPVSMKYANALGVTDFVDGLKPDFTVSEDLFDTIPIGDPSDPLLAKALELITGEDAPAAKIPTSIPYTLLENSIEINKGNVMFSPNH